MLLESIHPLPIYISPRKLRSYMSKLPDHITTITLDSTGEITKRPWLGTFKIKLLLSHSERLAFERRYKELLPNDSGVDDDTKFKASALAELSVRVVEAPDWWDGSKQGMNLVDAQPVIDLLFKVHQGYKEWLEKVEQIAKEEAETL